MVVFNSEKTKFYRGLVFAEFSRHVKKKDLLDSPNFHHNPWFPDHKANSKN